MKNITALSISTIIFLTISCREKKEAEKVEKKLIEQEIKVIDSVSSKVETLKNEIEDSSKKLDELLDEL